MTNPMVSTARPALPAYTYRIPTDDVTWIVDALLHFGGFAPAGPFYRSQIVELVAELRNAESMPGRYRIVELPDKYLVSQALKFYGVNSFRRPMCADVLGRMAADWQ